MRNMTPMELDLYNIGMVSFIMYDFALYLDTHPDDANAKGYFTHYKEFRLSLTEDFSKTYYPLTLDEVDDTNEWNWWGDYPLPWEGGTCE